MAENGNIAPVPVNSERAGVVYERKVAPSIPGQRGPLRFEEGIATDTDVPNEFQKGIMQGYVTAPGRPNHNANVWEKSPQETMAERAHIGSAAWVEAETYLREFAGGTGREAEQRYIMEVRSGRGYERVNPATVTE